MSKLTEFIAYLEEQVKNHSIYVWGAQGQAKPTITEAWIRAKETSAENADRAIAYWKKQVTAGYGDVLRAFDCSGLGMYWLYNLQKLYSGDMTSNTMMGKCERLTRDKLKKGDWVFRVDSSGKAYHIGYVVDDALNVIECMGRDVGAVKRSLNASGTSYWNVYGRPEIFRSDFVLSLKKGDKGEEVRRLQELLMAAGYSLPKHGMDADYGDETETAVKAFQRDYGLTVNGLADDETMSALELMASSPKDESAITDEPASEQSVADELVDIPFIGVVKGNSVNVRSGRGSEFEKVCVAYNRPGEVALLLLNDLRDGWYHITLKPKDKAYAPISGYISAQYVQRKEV